MLKSMDDYLETKRLTFPRLYFLSMAELMDLMCKKDHKAVQVQHIGLISDEKLEHTWHVQRTCIPCFGAVCHCKAGHTASPAKGSQQLQGSSSEDNRED